MKTFVILFVVFVGCITAQNPQIKTNSGIIEGISDGLANKYWGIPYANPPINDMRWNEPEYVTSWDGIKLTQTEPPGCLQICTQHDTPHICPPIISEDCLYLNVFTPINATIDSQLSTMVFIHGGNFKLGWSGGLLYNGTKLANATNTIIVTMNYRVGILGFLWSREIGMNGNFGMLDQRMALQWVYNNIKAFGGDRDKITIYGQSAGAMSVALHLMEQSQDETMLYQYAIMESEPFSLPMRDTTTWGDIPRNFFKLVGCDYDVYKDKDQAELWKCIRAVNGSEILNVQGYMETELLIEVDHFLQLFMPWAPTMGTGLYPDQPVFAFQQGLYRDIPFMIGTTSQEGVSFIWGAYPDPITYESVAENLVIMLGPSTAEQVLLHYPPPLGLDDYRFYYSVIATDGIFACPTRNITAQHYQSNVNKTSLIYLYHFNHASSFNENQWGNDMQYCWGNRVCHGEELPYIFHPNGSPINVTYENTENELAFIMQEYWTTFAKTGNPSNGGNKNNIDWLPFILGSEPSIKFDCNNDTILINIQSQYDIQNNKCQFWDTTGYAWIK